MKLLSQTGLAELISKIKAWGAATFLDKTDVEQTTTIGVDSAPTSGSTNLVTSGGVYNAIPTALSELTDDSTHRIVTDAEKATWNSKQEAISDLADIRSGASFGATALQSVPSTYRTASAQDTIDAGSGSFTKGADVN